MDDHGEPHPEEMPDDEAEYAGEDAPAGPACGLCHREIEGEYYEANGMILCAPCREAVGGALASGSGMARFLRAFVFGFGAAVAGFAIYFGVLKLTGYEIGLISILVGLMVGGAVRKGSGHRGGWAYQLLAMFLVYSTVVASYAAVAVPLLIAEAAKDHDAKEAAAKENDKDVNKPGAEAKGGAAAEAKKPLPSPGELAVALLALLGFLYALPVLMGFQSPMGLLIIGFALWEAWKINRATPIVFRGPFPVGQADEVVPDYA